MKTPREMLLVHHRAADVKLDAIRQSVVAGLAPGAALASANLEINAKAQSRKGAETAETQVEAQLGPLGMSLPQAALAAHEASSPGVFAALRLGVEMLPQKLWRELVWPCRRTWAGLAAVWLVLLTLQLVSHDPVEVAARKTPPPSPEMLLVLKQQRLLLAELVERPALRAADRPKAAPSRPRSQRQEPIGIA